MKKGVVFFLGVLTGVVLTFAGLGMYGTASASKNPEQTPGLTMFDGPGEVFRYSTYEVLQVFDNGAALVDAKNGKYDSNSIVLFFLPGENDSYYDDQILNIKTGYRVRQVGTYRYTTNLGLVKTVPAVRVLDK